MAEFTSTQAAALSSDKVARARAPHTFTPGRAPTEQVTGKVKIYRTEEFMRGAVGMTAIDGSARERLSGSMPPEKTEFRAETIQSLIGTARAHTRRLIAMNEPGSFAPGISQYQHMKDLQQARGFDYAEDGFMLELFSRTVGGQRVMKTDAEISDLMVNHPKMIESMTLILERNARDTLAALGLRAETIHPGNRIDTTRLARVIDLPVDQGGARGAINRATEWAVSPSQEGGRNTPHTNLRRATLGGLTSIAGGAVVGAVGGAIAGPGGVVVGGVVGAFGTLEGLRSLRQGVRIALVHDEHVLAQARSTSEAYRARIFLGVDPAANHEASYMLEPAYTEAIRAIYLRSEVMQAMHVPAQQLDAFSEQYINNPGHRPEDTGLDMLISIRERYDQLLEQNPPPAGLTQLQLLDGQRNFYRRAYEQVLIERLRSVRTSETIRTAEEETKLLNKAIEGRAEGGVIRTAAVREPKAASERLTTDGTRITETGRTLTAYQDRLRAVNEATANLNRALARINRGGATLSYQDAIVALTRARISPPGGGPAFVQIEVTDPTTNTVELIGNYLNLTEAEATRQRDIDRKAARPARAGYTSNQAYDKDVIASDAQVDLRFESEFEQIRVQKKLISDTLKELTDLNAAVVAASGAAIPSAEATSAEATTGARTLAEINQAYERVRTILAPAGGGAAPTAINLDFTTLMHDVSTANRWNERESNQPENRELVHRAIIQQRMINQMHDATVIPNNGALDTSFTNLTNNPVLGRRINAEQLRAMSMVQIVQRDAELATAAGGAVTPQDDLERARQWAMQQVEQTQASIQEEARLVSEAREAQERIIRNQDFEAQTRQLELIRAINSGRAGINERAGTAYFVAETRARLLDNTPLAPNTEGYTLQENASGLPRNVVEIVNILTNYQGAGDPGKGEAFQSFIDTLNSDPANPNRFLVMLAESFEMTGARTPANLTVFADQLQRQLVGGLDAAVFNARINRLIEAFVTWGQGIR